MRRAPSLLRVSLFTSFSHTFDYPHPMFRSAQRGSRLPRRPLEKPPMRARRFASTHLTYLSRSVIHGCLERYSSRGQCHSQPSETQQAMAVCTLPVIGDTPRFDRSHPRKRKYCAAPLASTPATIAIRVPVARMALSTAESGICVPYLASSESTVVYHS